MSKKADFKFADHTPPHRGVEVTINGQALVMPSVLMRRAVDLQEAIEGVEAGEIRSSAFLKKRNEVLEQTVRRNYPDVPDVWFDELDAGDYLDLNNAATEATKLGKKTAANL